jgi:tRNA pseudouridine55 synthase
MAQPASLDGVLVVDKPAGLTSHDVVAAVRRALGRPKVGHTGTLDPLATGVLPLLVGRATRLARFLAGAPKSYDARVRLGWSTTTYDAAGEATTPRSSTSVARPAIDAALERFRGGFEQRPPAFSAKKVDGRRAYDLARGDASPELTPVRVTVHALDVIGMADGVLDLRLTCSAGFYVRSLAHDLGEALGTGAHLVALRRTASGPFTLADAHTLDALLGGPDPRGATASVMRSMADTLAPMPAIRLDDALVERVRRGQDVPAGGLPPGEPFARLLTPEGQLAAVAAPGDTPGALHPVVVLM